MFDPVAMILADKATRRIVASAGPDQPVTPEPAARHPRTAAARTLIATTLRRLANRVEPRPVQTCQAT